MSELEKNALVSRFKFLNRQICIFMRQYRDKSAMQGLKKYTTRYRILFLTSKAQKHLLETKLLVVWTWIKITYLSSRKKSSILKILYCNRKTRYCNTFPTVINILNVSNIKLCLNLSKISLGIFPFQYL
jgi:hypothetical protein